MDIPDLGVAETVLADLVSAVVAYCTVSLLQVQVEDVVAVEEVYLFVIYKSILNVTMVKRRIAVLLDFHLINTMNNRGLPWRGGRS